MTRLRHLSCVCGSWILSSTLTWRRVEWARISQQNSVSMSWHKPVNRVPHLPSSAFQGRCAALCGSGKGGSNILNSLFCTCSAPWPWADFGACAFCLCRQDSFKDAPIRVLPFVFIEWVFFSALHLCIVHTPGRNYDTPFTWITDSLAYFPQLTDVAFGDPSSSESQIHGVSFYRPEGSRRNSGCWFQSRRAFRKTKDSKHVITFFLFLSAS